MRRPLTGSGWVTAAAAAVLASLLVVIAHLQYRWTSALARASEERAQGAITQAATACAGDFDRELLRLLLQFRDVGRGEAAGAELARRAAAWRTQALYPDILRGVLLVHRDGVGAVSLAALDEKSGAMRSAAWPAALAPLRDELARPPAENAPPPLPAVSGVPAWLVPLAPREGEPHHAAGAATDFALLWLDSDALRRELLPALVERHFGRSVDYRIEVHDPRGVLLYGRGTIVRGSRPDVRVPLFRLASAERFHHRGGLRREARGAGLASAVPGLREPMPPGGSWTLWVTHPAGSVAAAAERVRRHNLVLSLTSLGLLAAALALVVITARRAQELARRQIELVAGVSHELLTPVAALRSAGENLAAGVVTDPDKVREYGALVEREGRRLGTLVDQVLTWAGLQARGAPASQQPVDAAALVESVTRACAAEARRAGVRVETRVADPLPVLAGDPGALERALRNLVENALRHGRDGGWVGVGAERLEGGGRSPGGAREGVALWVEDRGPGIEPAELRQLFEPFHRGKRSLEKGVPGSGLGLALARQIAEAHGGRLRAASTTPHGMRFTLELPASRSERTEELRAPRAAGARELTADG